MKGLRTVLLAGLTALCLAGCANTPVAGDEPAAPPSADSDNDAENDAADSPTAEISEVEAEESVGSPFGEGATGEFDFTDKEGYTYHIELALRHAIVEDSTVGKPGETGVVVDNAGSTITITNTTPGKKAPMLSVTARPLVEFVEAPSWEETEVWCTLDSPIAYQGSWSDMYDASKASECGPGFSLGTPYLESPGSGRIADLRQPVDEFDVDQSVTFTKEDSTQNPYMVDIVVPEDLAAASNFRGWVVTVVGRHSAGSVGENVYLDSLSEGSSIYAVAPSQAKAQHDVVAQTAYAAYLLMDGE